MEEGEIGCGDWYCHHQLQCGVLWTLGGALEIEGLPTTFWTSYAEILPER